jgi:glucose-1-phosphate adenylyltransferase
VALMAGQLPFTVAGLGTRLLPATKIRNACAVESVIAEGCLIEEATIEHCLIGIRSVIGRGVNLSNSYIMGNDYYETEEDHRLHDLQKIPDIGIGDGTTIENAIVDKNVRIGKNVVIKNVENRQEYDDGWVFIREGIVVVPRNGILPDNYRI